MLNPLRHKGACNEIGLKLSLGNRRNTETGDLRGRRRFLKLASAGIGAAVLDRQLPGLQGVTSHKAPNIIMIIDDQHRQDMNKFIPTPAADRLAREGITFVNSLSTTPLCTPFRGMLMTGRFPTHSGIVLNYVNASPIQNPDCLANVFARAGYNTGYIGKWHLSASYYVADGPFGPDPEAEKAYVAAHPEPEFTPPGPNRLGFDFWQAYNLHGDHNNYRFYEDKPKKIYSSKYETNTEIDQAIDYIEKHKDLDKPFLLCVSPSPPHTPWNKKEVPNGYLEMVPKAEDLYRSPNVPKNNDPMHPEQLRCYLAMAKNFDDNLGRLMNYLDRSSAGPNTILIFTSDHGEMAGSHGRTQKMVPYAEAVNTPLRIRWPGKIPAGVMSDALFTPIDHLPTLCGLAGLVAPSMVDGEDLSSVVLNQAISHRDCVLMANYTSHWNFFQTGTKWPEWRGVHTKRYTYVKWFTGQENLFDNISDPYQMHDLVREDSAVATLSELRWRLKELMITAHDDFLDGRQYASWYDKDRDLVRTGLGPVHC